MMAIRTTTKSSTEADLEAEIHAALRLTFPWLPDGSIRHQVTFSFSFGGKRITVDGAKGDVAHSRADILLYWNERPLAVLELKRAGLALDADDDAQGLAYAGVLYPRPPLVVVTNGTVVRFLETHAGKEWIPEERSQEAFTELIRSASLAATHDLKAAISTLMGWNPAIWAQALRHTSEENLADLSGDWNEPLQPFVPKFLIPREATQAVLQELRDGKRLVLVEGPPLIGKSNVLRELCQQTRHSDDFVIFFAEADAGAGIFQQLADTLSQALSWPVSSEEVRSWLLRLSHGTTVLVLAVDGLGLSRNDFCRDIVDLTSHAFGSSVRLVLAVDDTVADRLVLNSTARRASAIGRRATRVSIGPLNDQEFAAACRQLWEHHAGVMHGGEFSAELRTPWVLRAIMSDIVSRSAYADKSLAATIPPFLGLDLLGHVRKRFSDEHELRRLFRATAQAVVEDSQDHKRPISLILESVAVYVVRRGTLRKFLEHAEIKDLVEKGYLRPVLHESGTSILVIRIPELLASEAADLLALKLIERARTDAEDAASWLSQTAGRLPLGDIVATQALLDAVTRHSGDLPFNVITALVNSPPRQQGVQPGTKMAMDFPGVGFMNMTFQERGVIEVESRGRRHLLTPEPGDQEHVTYADFHSWLILSHLGGLRFAMEYEKGKLSRVDPAVLLEVGACPIVLRRADRERKPTLVHDILGHGSIVCHDAGIIEPVTLSILRFLNREGEDAAQWLEEVVRQNSVPLLARTDIALRELSESANPQTASFARRALRELIRPALSSLVRLH